MSHNNSHIIDFSNVPDTSDTFKIVIFAEANKDQISFLNGLPYHDPTGSKFPTQAHDFAKNNPIIGGKPAEYLVVVGSGETQIENAFNIVAGAEDKSGGAFVTPGTKLFVMGHASLGTAKTGEGGTFGKVSPAGWKNIIQDAGLYDQFDQVAYGACQQGEGGACVNLSFAFGTDTEVIAQTDYRWGEGSTVSAFVNNEKDGDWSKTQFKNPADTDGTFADAVHSVGSGQVVTTGYDRKQTKFAALSDTPYKLDDDPRLEDIGYAGKTMDQEELDIWTDAGEDIATSPEYVERWSGRPEAIDEPEGTLRDVWTDDLVPMSTGGDNLYGHMIKATSAERKEFLDEKYGIYDDEGNLTGHSVELETYTDQYQGHTVWDIPDEAWDEFEDWGDKKTDQTKALYKMVTDDSGGHSGAEWIPNESGQGGTVKFKNYEGVDYSDNKALEDYGWTFNEVEGTLDVPDYNMPVEFDADGNQMDMFMTTGHYGGEPGYVREWDLSGGQSGAGYMTGYGNLMANSKYSEQQGQRAAFQQGTEWDTYYEQESLRDRWDAQYRADIETELEEQGIYKPEYTYEEGTMLLDSDNMIPSVDELVANPGSETDLMLNQDLNMPDRIASIWSQYEDRNPVALDAFNQASDKLLGLGVEPNTAYWDKLIGLEALSIYAASDE